MSSQEITHIKIGDDYYDVGNLQGLPYRTHEYSLDKISYIENAEKHEFTSPQYVFDELLKGYLQTSVPDEYRDVSLFEPILDIADKTIEFYDGERKFYEKPFSFFILDFFDRRIDYSICSMGNNNYGDTLTSSLLSHNLDGDLYSIYYRNGQEYLKLEKLAGHLTIVGPYCPRFHLKLTDEQVLLAKMNDFELEKIENNYVDFLKKLFSKLEKSGLSLENNYKHYRESLPELIETCKACNCVDAI